MLLMGSTTIPSEIKNNIEKCPLEGQWTICGGWGNEGR